MKWTEAKVSNTKINHEKCLQYMPKNAEVSNAKFLNLCESMIGTRPFFVSPVHKWNAEYKQKNDSALGFWRYNSYSRVMVTTGW